MTQRTLSDDEDLIGFVYSLCSLCVIFALVMLCVTHYPQNFCSVGHFSRGTRSEERDISSFRRRENKDSIVETGPNMVGVGD
jgi:hypothetical protein